MSWIRSLLDRHERLKNYVHNGFRYPLPKYGQYVMGFVYFSIPVISGWYIMQWAISKSHDSIGYYGEHLPQKSIQGVGDLRPVLDEQEQQSDGIKVIKYEKVGAGGWGGGVHLVVSDEEEQKRNRKKLRKLLKKLQVDQQKTSNNDDGIGTEKEQQQS
jgi:hypothetical protein